MAKQSDKQRIVALQKALRIARSALERAKYYDRHSAGLDDALEEIDKLDRNSKPDLVQQVGWRG